MKHPRPWWRRIGPGFITGAADDDPSGIATYAQTGVTFGYGQLWTALFTLPFMIAVQEMCGRIGLVTGSGLAGVIRKYYSKPLLYVMVAILLVANMVNIGADLGAMASAAQLLVPIPFIAWLIAMTVVTLALEILVSYPKYSRILKYLTLSLLAYVITAFVVKQNWQAILAATFVPTFVAGRDYLMNILALLGTTISPYLFFWQADEEVEEEIEAHKLKAIGEGRPKVTSADIRGLRLDTVLGMAFSNFITFFIIVTAASTLRAPGIVSIDTAAQAAEALRPIAGNLASLLFALGIVGVGLLAVPVLAGSAAYAVTEAVRWRGGLYLKFSQAHGFYAVIALSTCVGLLINFLEIPTFHVLYYTAVLNALAAPPLLFLILAISNNQRVMGKYVNTRISNILGIIIAVIMTVASGVYIVSGLARFGASV